MREKAPQELKDRVDWSSPKTTKAIGTTVKKIVSRDIVLMVCLHPK